jgi:ribosomal protein S18 acetylase RimI-like enzyme
VVDSKTDGPVGETWYVVQQKGGKTQFWIDWIWIDPLFRRRGFGSQVLRQLAKEAARLGADRLELSVVSDNPGAMALYRKPGYAPWRFQMVKQVKPPRRA